jgi:glycosyltransferase involved in cell wall biosynthesis
VRIAILSPEYGVTGGGLGRHVESLSRRVAGAGHDVDVLTHGTSTATLGRLSSEVVAPEGAGTLRVFRYSVALGRRDLTLAADLLRDLEAAAADFDVIHAHGQRALQAVGGLHPKQARVVVTPHWQRVSETRLRRFAHPVYRRAGASGLATATAVICSSDEEAARVLRHIPELGDRLHVVPNGADVAAIRQAEPVREFGRIMLTVARRNALSRPGRLITALPGMAVGWRLAIVGQASAFRDVRALAHDLGVADRVLPLGRLDDATYYRWLVRADVVGSMSADGDGNLSLYEARAAGAPVVAANTPSNRLAAAVLGDQGIRLVDDDISPLRLADELMSIADDPRIAVNTGPTSEMAARQILAIYEGRTESREAPERLVTGDPSRAT